MFKLFVSESCVGEKCKCGGNATHKIGEQISSSDPSYGQRHEFTAYVCCGCFCKLLGTYEWCGLTKNEADVAGHCICTQLTALEPVVNPDCPVHGRIAPLTPERIR